MSNRIRIPGFPNPWISVLIAGILAAGVARASDQEGCLLCHRLELRVSSDAGEKNLKVHDPPDWIHGGLYCSDCHPDARNAPHPVPPGEAQCIGECHGGSDGAIASHRRAAYAGFTESHRRASPGASPCKLCHSSADHKSDRSATLLRCAGCHRREYDAATAGPHGSSADSARYCVDCHPAHPEGVASSTAGVSPCVAQGCHLRVTPRMRALADHRKAGRKGRMGGHTLLFFLLGICGWAAGRFLSPPERKEEDRS